MRRSFNTICLNKGVNEIVLRAMMGHASQEMTELYAGVPIEEKHRSLEAFADSVLGSGPDPFWTP